MPRSMRRGAGRRKVSSRMMVKSAPFRGRSEKIYPIP
jgi:hypothetical protein